MPDFLGGSGCRYTSPPYLTLYPSSISSVCLKLFAPLNVYEKDIWRLKSVYFSLGCFTFSSLDICGNILLCISL